MDTQPEDIVIVQLEAVLMPNGDIVSLGKTLGQFEKFKKALIVKPAVTLEDVKECDDCILSLCRKHE